MILTTTYASVVTRAGHIVTFTLKATVSFKAVTLSTRTISNIAADSLKYICTYMYIAYRNILKVLKPY